MSSASTYVKPLSSLRLATEYRTGAADLAYDFYIPCLERCTHYDRAAGYFRSSVLLIIQQALVNFARRGGRMRLVCSPQLTEADIEALARGYEERSAIVGRSLTSEIDTLLSSVATRDRAIALATLITTGHLSVRIAFRLPGQGIYHEKLGIFIDAAENAVSFKGSINESWNGWHELGNLESFEVFCSWENATDAARIARHRSYFEDLWFNRTSGVSTESFPEAALRNLLSIAKDSLDELELGERTMPERRTLLPHQANALSAWTAQNSQGILEHATGSGKTFTAMSAIRTQFRENSVALVLVPSRLLLEQWSLELSEEFPEATILRAGAGHDTWRNRGRLEGMTMPAPDLGQRIVLATTATGHSEEFRGRLVQGPHLFLVADEVHRLGSAENRSVLTLIVGPRLGLSATPRRFGDPDGTAEIFRFFNGVVPPPFSLGDAVAARRLVPYEYFAHPVNLTAEEAEAWSDLATKINQEIAKNTDAEHPRPTGAAAVKIKHLQIRRARVTKKAVNKTRLALRVVQEHYTRGTHWLLYCEDIEQLTSVLNVLRSAGYDPLEYHSKMTGDRRETLAWFARNGGLLVSVNCLDEGIDIPVVSHALILASSQNPRQFIQRRGRVLRHSPGKTIAFVHDALVIPPPPDPDLNSLDGIFRNEIRRAVEFARAAINRSAESDLMKLSIDLGIQTPELEEAGIEEDDELN
jgi:superfamily II DNA or RNA helicase